jgi:hypothetical protein
LYQEHHINIPWAIIDQVGGELQVSCKWPPSCKCPG